MSGDHILTGVTVRMGHLHCQNGTPDLGYKRPTDIEEETEVISTFNGLLFHRK